MAIKPDRFSLLAGCKKIFWDHFSKSLVTIQVFASETWAPIGLKNGGNYCSSHFVSLPSRAFHFSGGTTAIKAWNVGREGHQLFHKIMRKDYLWRRKKCSQNIWTVTAEIIWDHFEIRDTRVMTFLCTFSL